MTSQELAKSVRTNPTVVRRLVARLAQAGLVRAYKGKLGGIELAREAAKIPLSMIYTAVANKTLLQTSEKSPRRACPVSCAFGRLIGNVIAGLEQHSVAYLSRISIADLAADIPQNPTAHFAKGRPRGRKKGHLSPHPLRLMIFLTALRVF